MTLENRVKEYVQRYDEYERGNCRDIAERAYIQGDNDRHRENDEKEKEIINEVIRRRDRAIKEKVRRAQSPAEIENNPVVMSAYDFYRGIEYELNKLLGWLGYEE